MHRHLLRAQRSALRAAACALAAAACARDLAVPTQPPPPSDLTLAPALGWAATARVSFGDQAATVVSDSRDETSLVVVVPEDAGAAVAVATPAGQVSAAARFVYLGLGHPRGLSVRATVDLSVDIDAVGV